MIRHVFKLMWNQKRKNLGLALEVFVSFLVIFAVFSFLVYNFKKYREPLGFDYDRILVLQLHPKIEAGLSYEDYQALVDQNGVQIDQQLSSYPEFESYTFSNSIPFTRNQTNWSLQGHEKSFSSLVYSIDEKFPDVMDIRLEEGRWFNAADRQAKVIPIIINKTLREHLFADEEAIGKEVLSASNTVFQVVGLVDNFKAEGEFSKLTPLFFTPQKSTDPPLENILIKVKPDVNDGVKARLFNDIKAVTKNWTMEINYMDELRHKVLLETWIPALLFLTIGGFLIFNVALGLFGVVWQNINMRSSEIGVRRAMGATKSQISFQIIGETVVLATLSLAVGIFFAVQVPLLQLFQLETEVYLIAIGLAVLFIYVIVSICAFYPSPLAARVHPALALHEE